MSSRLTQKVLLIGWDAADWRILRPLMDQGLMPAFSRLVSSGVQGKILSLRPILSPMLWTTVATGKLADKHGIYGFVEPKPDASGIRPVTSTSRRCKAIWNILSQKGLRSNVVGWFASYPAEPIRGVVVSDRYAAQIYRPPAQRNYQDGVIQPPQLIADLNELVVNPWELNAEAILPFIPDAAEIDQATDDRLRKLAKLLAKTSTIHAAACRVMVEEPWDFMAVYYDGIDHFGHTFMPYHPPAMPEISPRDAQIYGKCVTGCYRFHDMMLDAMLQYAGPDTTVVLVSDHGFHSDAQRPSTDGYANPIAWHRPFGIVVVAGPGIKSGQDLYGATLADITPSILSLFGLPVGADMDGRPWLEIFNQPVRGERILSWEQNEDGQSGMHSSNMQEDPDMAAESIRQLVELGYIEAPPPEAEQAVARVMRQQLVNRAMALTNSTRRQQALPLWEQLVQLAQEEEDHGQLQAFLVQLAFCLLNLGRYDRCELVLQSLDLHHRHSVSVELMLAEIRIKQNRPKEALVHLDRAGDRTDIPQAKIQIGQAKLQLGRIDEAEEAFHTALKIDDELAAAYHGLACAALVRQDFERVLNHSLCAVGLTHAMPMAHYHLGLALAKMDRMEEAIFALKTAIGLQPHLQCAHKLLGEIYSHTGRNLEKFWHHSIKANANGVRFTIDPDEAAPNGPAN